ncbi:TetR family transcriptional regulator [Nocardia brasiliensis]|uniref:TetR family transcriptional regulator n=1 Tax=Nocardia brasiliensis TaxID=37326 RepID=A0A6G9XYZ9_NOCBR|nr:TetR/AcrR family transcriptional regulator C-terminal domain-containing protein [Nocardia brasiliensis]QIS06077.1 TetR family transcriptional regulator [Nocardia brasiliensis]
MPTPTTVELLWGIQQRPKRGPKPALSLAGIVAEAIAIADAEGLANLSMQRLAESLGFTKMSLYRYVPGKEQLTALMLDTALGAPPERTVVPQDSAWRTALSDWAETLFERYRAHPWAIELTVGARPMGPNEMAWMESALAALADTGLTAAECLDSIVLLAGHVRSLVQQVPVVDAGAFQNRIASQLAEMVAAAAENYPRSVAAFTEEGAAAGGVGALRFGIGRILDGLGVLIGARAMG